MLKNEIFAFLSENKEFIFTYHKNYSPFFPGCCADITPMLHHFILQYYGVDLDWYKGTKKLYPNNKSFHLWLQIDDTIIDFSLFQFYIGRYKFKKESDEVAYTYCIEEIQRGDITFKDNYYLPLFENIVEADRELYYGYFLGNMRAIDVNKNLSPKEALIDFYEQCKPLIKKN